MVLGEMNAHDSALFKSALKSQNTEVAKHRAAMLAAKAAVKKQTLVTLGGVKSAADTQSESDAALFKQAFSDQKKDSAKAHAKAILLKAASKRMTHSGVLEPKHHSLSDARLFQVLLSRDRRGHSYPAPFLQKSASRSVYGRVSMQAGDVSTGSHPGQGLPSWVQLLAPSSALIRRKERRAECESNLNSCGATLM